MKKRRYKAKQNEKYRGKRALGNEGVSCIRDGWRKEEK